MMTARPLTIIATNTILYCKKWSETITFYRDQLSLPVTFASDWFVEFQLAGPAHLSIADESRATIKSGQGLGLTLTLRVEQADAAWQALTDQGLRPQPVRDHPWGGRAFFIFDPEGHRIEVWSASSKTLA
jgi:catechol 2,3-dioxygenase-like lactoylglutathione lyase family enzyme